MGKSLLARRSAAALLVIVSLAPAIQAQDRLKSYPGYDQYMRLAALRNGAMKSGQVVGAWADNGRGFDVERTFVRAARGGRFGLVGMSERARLLGGRFDVRSSPGGPTTISLVLPAWRPATVEAPLVAAVEALRLG